MYLMNPGSNAAGNLKLKKGQVLFKEGDKSRSMYLLQSGMIRLFTKRGNSTIEIDTIRPGQILGELAFLDGNPRSLTGEALTDCELSEISGPMFMDVLNKAPEWLKILLKTVVGRLRAANTRVRQLEASTSSVNYDKDGGKRNIYQYLTYHDFMKAATALLLAGTRNGKKVTEGIDVDLGMVNRYAHYVMQLPLSKAASSIEILVNVGLASTTEEKGNPRAFLKNVDALEGIVGFLNEENLLDAAKRHDISVRGLLIMSLIVAVIPTLQKDPKGLVNVDLGAIKANAAQANGGKEPFRNEEVGELVKLGYVSELKIKSDTQVFTTIQPEEFIKTYRCMQVVAALKAMNEQKLSVSGGSNPK